MVGGFGVLYGREGAVALRASNRHQKSRVGHGGRHNGETTTISDQIGNSLEVSVTVN